MSMAPTESGTHRAHLLGPPFAVNPSPNPHAVACPVRTPYTDSQYSQPEELKPTIVSTTPAALGVRFEALHADDQHAAILSELDEVSGPALIPEEPKLAWGDCPFPHVQVAEEPKLPAPRPHSSLFGAVSSCCSTNRPHTPPATVTPQAHAVPKTEVVTDLESPHTHSHAAGICCSGSHRSSEGSSLKHLGDTANWGEYEDVELGPTNFERVILRIDGLKCGCCDSGLSRTVGRIPAIRNFQINTVLARVELELDSNRLSVEKVIELLETRTGYKFEEQVTFAGQVLELIVTDPRRLQPAGLPNGVTRIEAPERAPWRPFGQLGRHSNTNPQNTTVSRYAIPSLTVNN